jgi:hypothetical protein
MYTPVALLNATGKSMRPLTRLYSCHACLLNLSNDSQNPKIFVPHNIGIGAVCDYDGRTPLHLAA